MFGRRYSKKLDGFWEDGYHYYVEIRGGRLTVRGYDRKVALETEISYDAKVLDRGERTVIKLKDNVLSRTAAGEPFTVIRELAYESGELKLLYYYTIMGETLYTLKKVDNGPFDHILIRDNEFLKSLQGRWYGVRSSGLTGSELVIRGNNIVFFGAGAEPFHVVSYAYDKDRVYLVPANLTDGNFSGFSAVEVLPGMLTARMIVFDARVPLSVFMRKEDVGKIPVPGDADSPMVNTMIRRPVDVQTDAAPGLMGFEPLGKKKDPEE
jgi:hypothetical protein